METVTATSRLTRWCLGLMLCSAAVAAVDTYLDNPWWKVVAAVALCAVVLGTCRGADAIDAIEDYEAVHPLPSYEPLAIAEPVPFDPDEHPDWKDGAA